MPLHLTTVSGHADSEIDTRQLDIIAACSYCVIAVCLAERTTIVDQPPVPAQVISAPDDITLTCRATTDPSEAENLRIQWRRNGDVINPPPRSRITVSNDGSQLTIRRSRVNDTAMYTCRAENGVDFDTVEIPVTVRGLTDSAQH